MSTHLLNTLWILPSSTSIHLHKAHKYTHQHTQTKQHLFVALSCFYTSTHQTLRFQNFCCFLTQTIKPHGSFEFHVGIGEKILRCFFFLSLVFYARLRSPFSSPPTESFSHHSKYFSEKALSAAHTLFFIFTIAINISVITVINAYPHVCAARYSQRCSPSVLLFLIVFAPAVLIVYTYKTRNSCRHLTSISFVFFLSGRTAGPHFRSIWLRGRSTFLFFFSAFSPLKGWSLSASTRHFASSWRKKRHLVLLLFFVCFFHSDR